MKAVLMLDMPKGCDDCPLRYYSDGIDLYKCCITDRQADWLMGREEKCPLKESPTWLISVKPEADEYVRGWNDCVNKIIGDEDETD